MASVWRLLSGTWQKTGRPSKPPSPAPSVPNAPTGLTVTTTSNTSGGLAWTAASLPTGATAVTGFRVYVNNVAVATVGVVTTYSVTGLAPGITYSVAVTALNTIGESAKSTAASLTTTSTAAVPLAPGSLAGSVLSDTSLSLTWTAAPVPAGAPAVTGYKVYRGSTVQATLGNVLTTTLTGLTAATTYTFYVVATSSAGQGAASPNRTLTTTNSSSPVVTNLPPQPGVVLYGDPIQTSVIPSYAHPGAMLVPGRASYAEPSVIAAAAAGATVLIYFDCIVWNNYGRYHNLLFNSSAYGAAVPKWPGPISANTTGDLADFRVGGILQSKLEAVLELMVSENPHMGGFFLDDVGSRAYFPNFDWTTMGSTFQSQYRAGAIAVCQTARTVADRHGLVFLVNGTWGAGTLAANGGGYPTLTTHGCSLAEGGTVEHHDGESAYWGPYMAEATSQWGEASPVTGGKPFCFVICTGSSGVTEYRNNGKAAWISQQTGAQYPGVAPYTGGVFHPTGLPSSTGG